MDPNRAYVNSLVFLQFVMYSQNPICEYYHQSIMWRSKEFPGKERFSYNCWKYAWQKKSISRILIASQVCQKNRGAARQSEHPNVSQSTPQKSVCLDGKLVNYGIPTRPNKHYRHLDQQDSLLCGLQDDDCFDAVIRCPRALALMREFWEVPPEETLKNTVPDLRLVPDHPRYVLWWCKSQYSHDSMEGVECARQCVRNWRLFQLELQLSFWRGIWRHSPKSDSRRNQTTRGTA
jgi:hypothetical protein